MVLISNARGIELAATAVCLSYGMSVQPDIPICVSTLPPSRNGGYAQVEPLHVAFREQQGLDKSCSWLIHPTAHLFNQTCCSLSS